MRSTYKGEAGAGPGLDFTRGAGPGVFGLSVVRSLLAQAIVRNMLFWTSRSVYARRALFPISLCAVLCAPLSLGTAMELEIDGDAHTGASDSKLLTLGGHVVAGACSADMGRMGPTNVADALQWAVALLMMLQANSSLVTQTSLVECLLSRLKSGVRLYTDYSGFGGPEDTSLYLCRRVESAPSCCYIVL